MAAKTVRLRIEGRVQGVWYRAWTVEAARRLGLRGWVRNRRDGSVEALVSGDEGKVAQLVEACHEGPPAAEVRRVAVEPAEGEPVPPRFEQRPTV